jgi:hypothetical protein
MNELYENRVKASIASLFNVIAIEVISKGNRTKTTILEKVESFQTRVIDSLFVFITYFN